MWYNINEKRAVCLSFILTICGRNRIMMDRGEVLLGIINLNKPTGKTSHDMVGAMRRILGTRRIGHAGTLDPCASGVLPILVGKATGLSDLLTEKTKTYIATVKLGIETDTYDTTGTVTKISDVRVSPEQITETAKQFCGKLQQLPPMYSAVKMNGKKLYELARQGVTVERKPRDVEIYKLHCFDFAEDGFKMEVMCSKGTYIRSLCYDLGIALGTCACMDCLIRTQSGPFFLEQSCTVEEVEQAMLAGKPETVLMPPEVVLMEYPAVAVPKEAVAKIKNGLRMRPEQLGIDDVSLGDCVRLYDQNELLCLSQVVADGKTHVLAIIKTFFG